MIRQYRESDGNFIMNSWKMSWVDEETNCKTGHTFSPGRYFRRAPGSRFFDVHSPVITHLLINSRAVLVYHCPDEPEVILGWLVGDRRADNVPIVHYIYVKSIFRKQGIARELFDELLKLTNTTSDFVLFTHHCELAKQFSNFHFDPMSIVV